MMPFFQRNYPSGQRWIWSLVALLTSCSDGTDQMVATQDLGPDPCMSGEADITDGLQSGRELRVVFDCVNRNGQFDSMVPLMDAMELGVISDGSTTGLDMWVDILNAQIEAAQESGVSLEVSDLAQALDQIIVFLDEEWLEDGIALTGQFLGSGAVEPSLTVLGSISSELVALRTEGAADDAFSTYLDTLIEVLCPDLDTYEQCTGDIQQAYRGMMDALKKYGQEDYAIVDAASLAQGLAGMFAPYDDVVDKNDRANEAFGRGLALAGKDTFLVDTLGTWVPDLYGDNPLTEELEGYDSRNANQSALYGVMELLSDPEVFSALKVEMDSLSPLIDYYYIWNQFNLQGDGVDADSGDCEPDLESTEWEDQNPANYGLDQVLRLLKAFDVDYRDRPECAEIMEPIVAYTGLYFEYSGSTNIATIMLELFAQIPAEYVALAVDAGSLDDGLLVEFNDLCGTKLLLNDYEALQASVHLDDVLPTTLLLLERISHASFPDLAGVGGMETTKDLVVALYDTHLLCEAHAWFEPVAKPGGPLPDVIEWIQPLVPGQPLHDSVTVPLLRALARLRGTPAETIAPPLAAGLLPVGEEIGEMVQGIGAVAYAAHIDGLYGGEPAFYQLNAILADVASYDAAYQGVEGMARTLAQEALVAGVLETLAIPEVQESVYEAYPSDGQTSVEFLTEFVNDGQLLELLRIVEGLLVELDKDIDATSKTAPVHN